MKRAFALAGTSLTLLGAWASGCSARNSATTDPLEPYDSYGGKSPGPMTPQIPATGFSGGGEGAGGPAFGAVVTQAKAPPPVSGGTLLVTKDGTTAVVADADRDQLYLVSLATSRVTTLPLTAGDEPGRLVEDSSGRVHVALRGAGALVTVNLAQKKIVDRRAVCGAPRGVAYDPVAESLYVACATGELVTLGPAGGAPTRSVVVERDLRDVIVGAPTTATGAAPLYVTRLKTAEVLTLKPDGTVLGRQTPANEGAMTPSVAWRAISTPMGAVAVVHQRGQTTPVSTGPGGYANGAGCASAIVESTVTVFKDGVPARAPSPVIPAAVLPVDIAASRDGATFAVAAAGNGYVPDQPGVLIFAAASVGQGSSSGGGGAGGADAGPSCEAVTALSPVGQVVSVAYTPTSTLLVQTREPAMLYAYGPPAAPPAVPAPPIAMISLSSVSRNDTGHAIFHSNSGAFVACASCHPEGLEDGRTWLFDNSGSRRTQSLRGTLAGTAPYHWEGNLADVTALSQEVFVQRMNGPALTPPQVTALQSWLFAIPRPAAAAPSASAQAGQVLFESASVGCTACHTGPMLTNNATLDVNTGGAFQVPSLIGVGWKAPFLHDGCATTLAERFQTPCTDGVSHGQTANLDATQIADLVSYLETL